ncbi:isopentenyl-diphosphate Delta-isomerase 1 [Diprion similis]|uniref:isopentenyl-diphosphate Delta-isomerase 1 n=1 Tax=Diprion similis TaxID=362088 RepID=UPI001EF7E70A|nr:isopentenyl-diphosphate Delta-isomerase 1 [Diprion similis]
MLATSREVRRIARETLFGTLRRYAKMQTATLQEAALEERCILVDSQDRPLGEASKRDCHRVGQDGSIPLHRAFSIFLFNQKGDLLLQKRSANKVTFPAHYTNTCCSHPLAEIPEEMEERNVLGIRKAAQRRLSYELGIPANQVQPNDFTYLTRIHYHDIGDGHWGEHEIDYILFLQKANITLDPNADEVSEVRWVSRRQMPDFLKLVDCPLTPWFQLILTHRLPLWWDNLQALEKLQDHTHIQRFE